MKKILVPTDFSEYSLKAAKVAAQIAKKTDARLFFLHIVSIPTYESGVLPYQSGDNIPEGLFILKMVKKKFAELFEQDFLDGVNVAEVLQFDGVYESVTKIAEKEKIDLIVMGTHGSSGFMSDYFIGSNTDKIVRRSTVPVLTVKNEIKDFKINELVFASDFNEKVESAFEKLSGLIELYNPKVHLLRIVTRDDFYYSGPMEERMENFAEKFNLKNYEARVFNAEKVQEGINTFSKKVNADVIAIATHGKKGLARLLNGAMSEDINKSADIPVITSKI